MVLKTGFTVHVCRVPLTLGAGTLFWDHSVQLFHNTKTVGRIVKRTGLWHKSTFSNTYMGYLWLCNAQGNGVICALFCKWLLTCNRLAVEQSRLRFGTQESQDTLYVAHVFASSVNLYDARTSVLVKAGSFWPFSVKIKSSHLNYIAFRHKPNLVLSGPWPPVLSIIMLYPSSRTHCRCEKRKQFNRGCSLLLIELLLSCQVVMKHALPSMYRRPTYHCKGLYHGAKMQQFKGMSLRAHCMGSFIFSHFRPFAL